MGFNARSNTKSSNLEKQNEFEFKVGARHAFMVILQEISKGEKIRGIERICHESIASIDELNAKILVI